MKKIYITLCFMFVASIAFGQITSEVISKDLDENGNIRVWCVHRIDGREVESNYPKIDGHYVYATRYSAQNFKGLDKKGVEDYILNDIKNYSNVLVQREFDKKAPKSLNQIKKDYNAQANQSFADTNLDQFVGKGTSVTEVKEKLDTNNDGVQDKEITIKVTGEKTETDI